MDMMIEMVKCECCGLKEDCTQDYIQQVRSDFDGKWLCGLCSEAVRYELNRSSCKKKNNSNSINKVNDLSEAVKAHMSFCAKYCKSNPATLVADGMRQMLQRRTRTTSESPDVAACSN